MSQPLNLYNCSYPLCNKTEEKENQFQTCSRCHSVRYCNKTCQKHHWKTHKTECRNMNINTPNHITPTNEKDNKQYTPDSTSSLPLPSSKLNLNIDQLLTTSVEPPNIPNGYSYVTSNYEVELGRRVNLTNQCLEKYQTPNCHSDFQLNSCPRCHRIGDFCIEHLLFRLSTDNSLTPQIKKVSSRPRVFCFPCAQEYSLEKKKKRLLRQFVTFSSYWEIMINKMKDENFQLSSIATENLQKTIGNAQSDGSLCKISEVHEGSPAELGGFRCHDRIIYFGPVNSSNFHTIESSIIPYIQSHKGQVIPVTIRRNEKVIDLELIPESWSGPGLLGCRLNSL